MSRFQWTEQYTVGLPEVDHYHQEMARLLDELTVVLVQTPSTAETVEAVLVRLIRTTEQHFADEEQHMRSLGYPAYDVHRSMHEQLLADLNDYRDSLSTPPLNGRRLADELEEWFFNHLLGADQDFARFIASVRVNVG